MNYITEAFKALEDVNEGIILEKVENQPVKKVAKKSIVESKQMHYTTRPNAKRSLKESYDEEGCIAMIHSIMAYPKKTYESGEDLVASEESNWKDYLKPYKDSLGREKVVELAQQQLNRPHHITKGVMTDSDGLSYNALNFEDELTEDTVKQNGKWVNKGKEGTHGTFKTKKQADAQRKAMFANGFKESYEDELDRQGFLSIIKLGDHPFDGYSILNDGYFEN